MTPRTGRRECYYLAPFDTAGGVPIVACGDAGFGFGSGTVSRLGRIDCALTRAQGVAVAVMGDCDADGDDADDNELQ